MLLSYLTKLKSFWYPLSPSSNFHGCFRNVLFQLAVGPNKALKQGANIAIGYVS